MELEHGFIWKEPCFGEAQFPLVDDYSTGRLAAKMKGDECVIHVGLAIVFEVKGPSLSDDAAW